MLQRGTQEEDTVSLFIEQKKPLAFLRQTAYNQVKKSKDFCTFDGYRKQIIVNSNKTNGYSLLVGDSRFTSYGDDLCMPRQ